MILKNEEDIRIKLLIPYLKDLGFDASEISFEDSFTIRIGRTNEIIRGKSDILCKRYEKNLFIIELKKDSHKITQRDVSQGISYAPALVNNIAPFTVISNGKETKIYDTISEIEITGTKISQQSEFWKNGCTLSTEQEMNIRYEALKNFISFSSKNLKIFCEDQIIGRMSPITGDISSSNSKYIETLHIQRQSLQLTFKSFINSDFSVFGLVGNAGVGKTCSMCSLALDAKDENFVFFYNAPILSEPILQIISSDLNLFFSSRSAKDVVLKKLDDLARFIKKKVIIFIDGIDENISNNFPNELSEISYSISKLKNIKLCISCKSTVWGRFLGTKDNKNHTYEEVAKFHPISTKLRTPCFLLENFNSDEVVDIIPIYQKAFGFKGKISKSLFEQLRNGFFLRIFAEVYSNKQIPEEINDIELIKKYLVQSLGKTSLGVKGGFRILAQIGITFIEHKFTPLQIHKKEGIEIDKILDNLNLPLDQELPQGLLDRNILVKSNTASEDSYNISFYYSKIRDYVICYHSFKLDKLDKDKFYCILESFFEHHIGESAINFFAENADNSKLDVYKKFKRDKLMNYAIRYNSFLDESFCKIKKEFNPKTEGKIGIVIPDDLIKKDGFALIPLESSISSIVHYDGFDQPISVPSHEVRIFKMGARSYSGSNSSLMVKNQIEVIKQNIYKQLKEIIEKGNLYEYDSDILLIEKITTILYFYNEKLNYNLKIEDFRLPRFNQIFPINLIKLRKKLFKFRAEHYYKRQNIERSLIDKLVDSAFEREKEIPRYNVTGSSPPFEELYKIVNILLKKGLDKIECYHLPSPDIPIDRVKNEFSSRNRIKINKIRRFQFSNKQVQAYIREFFKNVEIAYKQIVESCFPTLIDKLTFYNNIPHEYFFYTNDSRNSGVGWYGYRKSSLSTFKLTFRIHTSGEKPWVNDGISVIRGYSFERFIYNENPMQTIRNINADNVDEFCVLRNRVYELLFDDMKSIFKEYDLRLHRPFYF